MPGYEISLKNVPSLKVAKLGGIAPGMEQLGPTLDRLFDSVMEYISQQGATPASPATTLYLSMGEREIRVEACMPFNGTLANGEHVKVEELPAVEIMVTTLHHGSFSTLSGAYDALVQWTQANGYRISGPNRELNLVYERSGDEANFVTEVQFPVERT